MTDFQQHVSFIWSIAEILRGNYKQSEYGKVVLPFTVLRRLDCVLAPTREKVLAEAKKLPKKADEAIREEMLNHASGHSFHNTSRYSFERLLDDPANIAANLSNMVNGLSSNAREIFTDRFKLPEQIARLDKDGLLYLVVKRFAEVDLHPDKVNNISMGYIFEELIRRFSEQSNETAGEHFTPREVIRLMVDLLFCEDSEELTKKGIIRTLYDPACGTGGMLSVAEDYLRELNPDARLVTYGQELNDESYGICKSDMMIKGQDPANIHPGNSFTQDGTTGERFDYMLSNPPFGVEWKKIQEAIQAEHNDQGYSGRFGAGLPRVSDGSLLFVQHMISKFRTDGRTRLAVVLNGSPLFTGSAGSGESEIRRWIIENDWLEAIVALPTDMFYNTGIATYIWIITNQKNEPRKGKIQLIDATAFHAPMRKSLGSKRKYIEEKKQIPAIVNLFGEFEENEQSKIFDNADFGFRRVTVERPLKPSFAVTEERLELLRESKGFAKMKSGAQEAVLEALRSLGEGKTWSNREKFLKDLKKQLKVDGLDAKAPLLKMIVGALGERDEDADVCTDKDGNPEPDADMRDFENVPLKEDVEAYFQREVLPHVPDAWIDHDKTKVGYEIPFTRHFYKYVPPRSLEEIDADLAKVSDEIMGLLGEVKG